ncbi:conserved hypothetical copy number control protein CopG [Sulfolobus islandicus M.14.25]|uniref:Conserved hypothetical copy number control protein CopG n=1 Tax=Saccharolobus islandicus (strain M.14.25 / Kamchatka \|nr:conserved hypothetical copy number control protein CopG [Sulfolobus islandicus M.14.25]
MCGSMGYYAECPLTLEDRIYTEIKEGMYRGIDPYTLLRLVKVVGND